MPILVKLFGVLWLIATVIPFFRGQHWFFKGFEFFRLQLAIIGGLLIFGTLILCSPSIPSERILMLALAIGLLFQLYKIVPYFPMKLVAKPDVVAFSLVTANVLMDNERKADFIALIQEYEPACFLTLESDKAWEEALDTAFDTSYPYQVKVAKDNFYGMHLYSKRPLHDTEVLYLVSDEFPTIQTKVRLENDVIVTLVSIHPPPPSPTEHLTSEVRDAELMRAAKQIRELEGAIIACGDLNDVPWSKTTRLFKKVSGLLDPRIGRGFYCTFHASYPIFRAPIDQLFHSPSLSVPIMKRLPYFGSDHFAMYYEFTVNQALEPSSNIPTKMEQEEIEQLIERGQEKEATS